MSESIKLKIPEKTSAEKVSVGNFDAELKPGAVIEVENRKFADYLIAEFGAEEVVSKKKKQDTSDAVKDFGFPEDYPAREIFEKREIPYETVIGLDESQLTKIDGIGRETAKSILSFKIQPVESVEEPEAQNGGDQNSSAGENKTDGGQE